MTSHARVSPRSLYLIRHAIAAERGPKWPDDSRRPLTKRGEERMRRAVDGFARLEPAIDLILTSPFTRARDTATIVAAGLESSPEVRALDALIPGTDPRSAMAAVAKAAPRQRHIALVGHEPGLGQLAAWLIGAKTPLPFRKGGICRIDVECWPADQSGRLLWFATPKLLRR